MIGSLKNLFQYRYKHLNLIKVSKTALQTNYQYLSSLHPNLQIAPVVKSNAYGHGLTLISQTLDPLKAPFLCVDSLFEAYELYKAKIKTPILIMGYTNPENFKVKNLPFSYAVWDLKTLEVLNKYQKGAKIHLKIDTGMHRLGIPISELSLFLKRLKQFPDIKVEGVMSHLASAKNIHDPLFQQQIQNFKVAQRIINQSGIKPKWIHLAASEAILNSKIRMEIAEISNLGRAGLALYGISPLKNNPHLQPALQFISQIVQIKKIKKGERVGYEGTFTAPYDMVMGVLPLGYFDGVARELSDLGKVLVDGVECKIIGKVSMNITTIDLSKARKPRVGQEVIIYSRNPGKTNSLQFCAKLCRTIPYNLLVHLTPSAKRIITK